MGGTRVLVAALVASAAAVTGCSGQRERVHVLGRDYDRASARPISLNDVHQQSPFAVIVSHGKVVAGSRGLYAPTVIFVDHGGKYYKYALSGGP